MTTTPSDVPVIISNRRFGVTTAIDEPTFAPLGPTPGLGSAAMPATDADDVPDMAVPTRAQGNVGGIDSAWQNPRGVDRFGPPAPWYPVGHGAPSGTRLSTTGGDDPGAGLTRFPRPRTFSLIADYIVNRTAKLWTLGREDGKGPSPRYVGRKGFSPTQNVTPSIGLVDWTRAGPIPVGGIRFRPMTLRREFLQDEQSLSGLHTLVPKRARTPVGALSMIPAHQPRLTDRGTPGSFGETTEVLNA
jgi:hypothetical protein